MELSGELTVGGQPRENAWAHNPINKPHLTAQRCAHIRRFFCTDDVQVPEEKNRDGQWVPKGTKPALQLSHQQVGGCNHVLLSEAGMQCSRFAHWFFSIDCLFLPFHLSFCPSTAVVLFMPQADRTSGKCVYFVRVNQKGVSEKTLESDVAVGEIQGSALDTFKALLADLFLPLLQEQSSWGKMPPQHTKDFLTGVGVEH